MSETFPLMESILAAGVGQRVSKAKVFREDADGANQPKPPFQSPAMKIPDAINAKDGGKSAPRARPNRPRRSGQGCPTARRRWLAFARGRGENWPRPCTIQHRS